MPTETEHPKTNRIAGSKRLGYVLSLVWGVGFFAWLGGFVIKVAQKVAMERMAREYATTLHYVPSGRVVTYSAVPLGAWFSVYLSLALLAGTIGVASLAGRSARRYLRLTPGLQDKPPVNLITVALWAVALASCLVVTFLASVPVFDLFFPPGV